MVNKIKTAIIIFVICFGCCCNNINQNDKTAKLAKVNLAGINNEYWLYKNRFVTYCSCYASKIVKCATNTRFL